MVRKDKFTYVKLLYRLIGVLANLTSGLFLRRSGECSLPTTNHDCLKGRKLGLLTVKPVMMPVRDWSWLSIEVLEDTSLLLLKNATTLFCLGALSRSLVNACSSLSPCESGECMGLCMGGRLSARRFA